MRDKGQSLDFINIYTRKCIYSTHTRERETREKEKESKRHTARETRERHREKRERHI